MTGDTKAKGVGAQVETLIRDESMTELEKLAREATLGPWASEGRGFLVLAGGDRTVWICRTDCEADRDYIAAASPDVVLRLLSELKRLRSQVEEMRGALEPFAVSIHRTYAPNLTPAQIAHAEADDAICGVPFTNGQVRRAAAVLKGQSHD
jgi:hypothetical protein